MATMQGITGKLSGKMGSAVFRVRNGQQVVAQYNPVVANPNTLAQQSQRAKFKLMSQLTALMSDGKVALVGFGTMGITKRPAKGRVSPRNRFLSINFPLVSTSADPSDPNKVMATIAMERVQLTDSLTQFGTMNASANPETNSIEVIISAMPSLGSGSKSAKIVLLGYETLVNGAQRAYIHSVVDVPESSTPLTFTHSFTNLPQGNYTVLSFGMISREYGTTRVDYDNIHTPSDAEFISAVVIDQALSDGTMDVTNTIGQNTMLL